MKAINTRLVGLLVVVLMSIGSYIFLHTVSIDHKNQGKSNAVELKLEQTLQEETETEKAGPSALPVPEVELLKFVIETGKRFLPAS